MDHIEPPKFGSLSATFDNHVSEAARHQRIAIVYSLIDAVLSPIETPQELKVQAIVAHNNAAASHQQAIFFWDDACQSGLEAAPHVDADYRHHAETAYGLSAAADTIDQLIVRNDDRLKAVIEAIKGSVDQFLDGGALINAVAERFTAAKADPGPTPA